MAQSGWYPDPGGGPGQYRYWDGARWSVETTTDPGAPPPGTQPEQPRRRRGSGLLIAVLAGVAVLAVVVVLVVRSLSADTTSTLTDPDPPQPTISGWDDSSPIPTAPPPSSASPQGRQKVACATADPGLRSDHPADGRLHGGQISIPMPGDGWRQDDSYAQNMGWAYDVSGAAESVEQYWWAMLAVGELHREDGFNTPEQAADGVMQCIASSSYYSHFTGREDLHSKKVSIDGATGWSIRSNIRVDDPQVRAEGDVVEVIVLDTGGDELSYFAGFVPIDDEPRIQLLDDTIADIRVD